MPVIPVTQDAKGVSVQAGDRVRILSITPPREMEDDDVDMIEFMIGSICEIDRVDAAGHAWVTMWWSCADGVATSTVALAPAEMERVEGMLASKTA
ncbi:MAG TPA: hypothetical protein VGK09_15110 [Rhodocyclaceae bacterium]|jgi:hypothetical protein